MTVASPFLVIILVVLGVLALAAGITYYVEAAKSLPAFFPGHAAHLNGRHTTPGLAGIICGGGTPGQRCDHRTPRQRFVSLPLRERPGPRVGMAVTDCLSARAETPRS